MREGFGGVLRQDLIIALEGMPQRPIIEEMLGLLRSGSRLGEGHLVLLDSWELTTLVGKRVK